MLRAEEIEPETPRLIRREEYDRLVQLGFFDDERVELLEGVIVRMSPQGPEHANAIDKLTAILFERVHPRARIRVQSSFSASDGSQPEPDIALVPPGSYKTAHPQTAWLIIEVAKTSKKLDSHLKSRIYATAAVDEYWVVDVEKESIAVHTRPADDGYADKKTMGRGEIIRLLHFPDVEIRVDEVFVD